MAMFFSLAPQSPYVLKMPWAAMCSVALVLLVGSAQAQESAPSQPPSVTATPKPQEPKSEKPSAVVQKSYRCHGGKTLKVRYQLGARNVHAFVQLQGKLRELPWDGDYKLGHSEDERFSDGLYEMMVQGNFSRVTSVRRLASKTDTKTGAGAKPGVKGRDLLRACVLPKAHLPAQDQSYSAGRAEKKAEKAADRPKIEPVPMHTPEPNAINAATTTSPSPARPTTESGRELHTSPGL